MGPILRIVVEEFLLDDLHHYGIKKAGIKFDWSNSVIEGQEAAWLDGEVDNFSGILIFDEYDDIIAEGWMGYILEPGFFVVYWVHLEIVTAYFTGNSKLEFGIPAHILEKIPDHQKWRYEREKS